MLRVGLTGGIGAGKSTVAARLVELGATLIDADQVAREVVAPGTVGLARVIEAFGERVLDESGALDRAALAAIVFADDAARRRLNGIVHPLVSERTAELVAAAPSDGIVVQDIPLLVENNLGPMFPLVVVVHAPAEERIRRLVAQRGMTVEEAKARINAQADDTARRAAADVWLDNSGSPERVRSAVDALWRDRLVPFERNLRLGRALDPRPPRLVDPDPRWPEQFARLAARIERAAGKLIERVEHIGSTAVPGLPANDVLDLQLGVRSAAGVAELRTALREVGFLPCTGSEPTELAPHGAASRPWWFFQSADPGRPACLRVGVIDSLEWRAALLLRDWLRAEATAREEFLRVKRRALAERAAGCDLASYTADYSAAYAEAKRRWFASVTDIAERWAEANDWRIAN